MYVGKHATVESVYAVWAVYSAVLPSSLMSILILNDHECQVDTNSIFRYLSNEHLPHLYNLLVLCVLGILTLVLYPWEKDFPEGDLSRVGNCIIMKMVKVE